VPAHAFRMGGTRRPHGVLVVGSHEAHSLCIWALAVYMAVGIVNRCVRASL